MKSLFHSQRRISSRRTYRTLRLVPLESRDVPSYTSLSVDFGTATSPVATGYVQSTNITNYNAVAGYGWLSATGLLAVDRPTGTDLNRDFVQGKDATLAVDVPTGTYSVTIYLGDTANWSDATSVYLEGMLVGTAKGTTPNQIVSLPFQTTVTDGQLTIRVSDAGADSSQFALNYLSLQRTLPGTLTNTGPVAEGGSAQVTLSGVTGGTGVFTYSFDFGGDGTYEIMDVSSPTASVPASYLADGPNSLPVIARAKDSTGTLASNYTTTISVQNVAPSPITGGSYTGIAGKAIAFTGSATDPSAADTAAGFGYLWTFGDGATSTAAAPSHIYATVGSYSASLRVTDKDGGSTTSNVAVAVNSPGPVVIGNYIVTSNDRIPNFGANPTATAVASGNWSALATWSTGQVPVAGDIVSIGAGKIVTYDVLSSIVVKTVAIQSGGSLIFRTDVNTRLTVINLLVMPGGELQIGNAVNPVSASVKAEVIFADVAIDTVADPAQYGNGLIAMGKVAMRGATMSDTFVRLAIEPAAGATTLALSQPVTGWKAGDKVVLPDTRQLDWFERGAGFVGQWEMVTLSSVSANGLTLTLSQPLAFNHFGVHLESGAVEFQPHVGNLSRNVVVKSQNAGGTRGHTMYTERADVNIQFAQFGGLGRTRIDQPDSTTFDSAGNATHTGTNQLGRYPVQFLHLYGPTTTPANGYQFTFTGNSVFCPILPMPFRWGIDLNDAHYGLVKDNVLYNWAGAGIVGESGSESYNVIENNFVVRTLAQNNTINNHWQRADDRNRTDFAFEGVGLWFRGFNNYVRNNVSSGATSYGYTYFAQFLPNVRIPLFPGAYTTVSGQFQSVDMNAMPLLQFEGNEAYGVMPTGMTIWWLGTYYHTPRNVGQSVVKDLRVWHAHAEGYFGYETNRLVLDGLVVRGNYSLLAAGNGGVEGVSSSDYYQRDFTIRHADIEGMKVGFAPAADSGDGIQTVEDSFLKNYYNIYVASIWTSAAWASGLSARKTILRNVAFGTPGGPNSYGSPKYNIFTKVPTPDVVNYVQRDEMWVYDYNGVVGDNFQAYYLEQDPNYVLYQTTYNTDGSVRSLASPVAGLTNQQNWTQYGIALAGAIAPAVVTRSGIRGYVRAFTGTGLPPVEVSSVIVSGGAVQRSRVTSLEVNFDQLVTLPVNPAAAFQLTRQSDGATVGLATTVNNSGAGTKVTLTFISGAVDSGSLADGRFTLRILANSVSNANGTLDGNASGTSQGSPNDDYVVVGTPVGGPKLFRLFGDSDGSGMIDAKDFVGFRIVFGSSSAAFDFDNDGAVSANDFLQFRFRFLYSI